MPEIIDMEISSIEEKKYGASDSERSSKQHQYRNIIHLVRLFSVMIVIVGINAAVFLRDGSLDEKNAVRATLIAEKGLQEALSTVGSGDSGLFVTEDEDLGGCGAGFVRTVTVDTEDSVGIVSVSVRWRNLVTTNYVRLSRPVGSLSEKLVKFKDGGEGVTGFTDPLGGAFLPINNGEDSDDLATLGGDGVGGSKK